MPGDLDIQLDQWAFSGLRIASGAHTVQVGGVTLHQLAAQLALQGGHAQLRALHAARAELADLKIEGPVGLPAASAGHAQQHAGAWTLEPLATADGTIRAEIIDAHLLFDAQVTVPIGRGTIDFKRATVAHVGPNSRMGVSRMGIYVDAPNGRSYLYQFPHATVAGVSYERRGPLPGPWASDRGSLQLQPFIEAALQEGPVGASAGLTEQTRLLLGRTAVGGELQLGDGRFAAPGVQGTLAGRTAGCNRLRLHAEAVGRGIRLDIDALSMHQLVCSLGTARLACDEIAGSLALHLFVDGAQLRFALSSARLKLTGLQLQAGPPAAPASPRPAARQSTSAGSA